MSWFWSAFQRASTGSNVALNTMQWRVQVRIEGARGVVTEHGGHDVARGPVRALAILADASGREGLQLIQCRRDSLFVRLDNARVMAHQRGNGHRLGRREREIVEHAPIGVLAGLAIRANIQARGFLAHRQLLAGLRMKVLTETNEFVLACDTRQPQFLGSFAIPLAQDLLAFGVVVTDAQVFLEVLLGVDQSVLCFGSKHGQRLQVAREIALASSGRVAVSYAGL